VSRPCRDVSSKLSSDATTSVTQTTTEYDIYAVTSRKPKSTAPTVKAREMAEKELEWDWEYDEGQILKREVSSLCFEERLRLSSVAALVENLYRDDPTEQAFKCPVVVVARNWVLTTEECVGRDEWKNVSVRINSNYWSKGGFLRRVKRVSRFAKLVALGLERDSATDDCFRPIKTQPKSNSTEGRVLFWDGKITRPLKDRTKYGKLKKTNVKLLSRLRFEGCGGEAGAPLLDPNRNLVGFQVSKSCKEKSTATSRYRDVARRFGWLQMIKNII
jgi:hypothetical protein